MISKIVYTKFGGAMQNANKRMFSSTLKQKMEGLVAARQIEVKDFNKEHGKTVLGEVTVGQVIGGMRGLPAMLYETSKLHPVDGIKYRGMDLFEV
jgi:citrate synthase